ncbi:transcriptional regulator BolA [Sessilibacter sp. MAH1]
MGNTIEMSISKKVDQAFSPSFFSVENESYMHNVPLGSESHFKVVVVSDLFTGKRSVQRHQHVYKVLADELKEGVHALAIHAYTPEEWQNQKVAPASPKCMG